MHLNEEPLGPGGQSAATVHVGMHFIPMGVLLQAQPLLAGGQAFVQSAFVVHDFGPIIIIPPSGGGGSIPPSGGGGIIVPPSGGGGIIIPPSGGGGPPFMLPFTQR
jgi:hypothetical protein